MPILHFVSTKTHSDNANLGFAADTPVTVSIVGNSKQKKLYISFKDFETDEYIGEFEVPFIEGGQMFENGKTVELFDFKNRPVFTVSSTPDWVTFDIYSEDDDAYFSLKCDIDRNIYDAVRFPVDVMIFNFFDCLDYVYTIDDQIQDGIL